jgi:hypothetical protein
MKDPVKVTEKPRVNNGHLLTKTEIRRRAIFQKIISATEYLNRKYGVGKWGRGVLCDKVNLYLGKDNHAPLSLSSLDRYRRDLNNLSAGGSRVFSSSGEGLGSERGASFVALAQKDACHLVNIFFSQLKLERLRHQKVKTLRHQKVKRQTVNCFNQLNQSSVSPKGKEVLKSPVVVAQVQRRTETDSFSRDQQKGSHTYQKALRELEVKGIKEEDLKIFSRKIYHPITRENAIINLNHFVAEFSTERQRKAFEHFKHELIHYASNISYLRKGAEGYLKALDKVNQEIETIPREYKPPVPYLAPTGEIEGEIVPIENEGLRELMERLGKQIQERERNDSQAV